MERSPLQIPVRPLITPARVWGLVAVVCIGLSLSAVGLFQNELINLGGLPQLTQFFAASLSPELSPDFLQLTWNATLVTLSYAVCGTVLSILIGIVGGIFASEVWWSADGSGQRPWLLIRSGLAFPRAIHEMIWGLFFVNIFGLDPLVGILAIAIPYGAIVAKVFSEILDETPRQPLLALLNSGVPRPTAFLYTLLPQAFLNLLSYTFYRFECSIRSAAVLGVIGAGGLGYEILLSLQSLRYEQLWTLFYALFWLNGSVDVISAVLRQRLGSPSRLDLNFRVGSRSRPSIQWDRVTIVACTGLLLLVPFCFWYVGADFSKLWSARTGRLLSDIATSSIPPKFGLGELQQLVPLSLQTLAMSVLAIAAAGLGGILLSFPAAHNLLLPGGVLNPNQSGFIKSVLAWGVVVLTRSLLLIARAVPAPIWALVMLFVWFPGILPGAIALAIHNLGILGRLMAEVVENLDERPLVALRSQGAPGILVFLYGILPATLTRFLAYGLYRWEVCMRETVIVGLVGAGGLGRLLTEQLSSFDYRSVVVTLGCFIVLTFGVDWVSGAARRSLR